MIHDLHRIIDDLHVVADDLPRPPKIARGDHGHFNGSPRPAADFFLIALKYAVRAAPNRTDA